MEELDRKKARMVLDGANVDVVHEQLAKDGDALAQEMNDYIEQFISDNYENVWVPAFS